MSLPIHRTHLARCILFVVCVAVLCGFTTQAAHADKILIPMDLKQTNHLKAYGVTFHALTRGIKVEWLLNYRGGSFMAEAYPGLVDTCDVRGVAYEVISAGQENQKFLVFLRAVLAAVFSGFQVDPAGPHATRFRPARKQPLVLGLAVQFTNENFF